MEDEFYYSSEEIERRQRHEDLIRIVSFIVFFIVLLALSGYAENMTIKINDQMSASSTMQEISK